MLICRRIKHVRQHCTIIFKKKYTSFEFFSLDFVYCCTTMIQQHEEHPPRLPTVQKSSSQILIFNVMEWNINVAWIAYNVTPINLKTLCLITVPYEENNFPANFCLFAFMQRLFQLYLREFWAGIHWTYYQSTWNYYCQFATYVHLKLS